MLTTRANNWVEKKVEVNANNARQQHVERWVLKEKGAAEANANNACQQHLERCEREGGSERLQRAWRGEVTSFYKRVLT